MSEYILELKDVVKTFGGVKALNGVHFQLKRGEIHALMGENGAGKSTFIKVITGVHQPDSGIMLLDGEQVTLRNTTDSAKLGIAAIYQHVTAFPDLTVTENIFMGREIKNKFGFYDWKTMRQRAKEMIQPLSAEIDVNKPMGNLSVAEQQLVEIAKALSCDARILIMDEPTASLTRNECLQLYRIAKDLRDKGVSIIFITHRFEDMYELATRVTVFRDSTYVGSWDVDKITNADLVKAMVGRELNSMYPEKTAKIGDVVLEVDNISKEGYFKNISFNVRKGEILALTGLVGAGRTELLETIFGIRTRAEGNVIYDGKVMNFSSPKDAMDHGFALITEERKANGLFLKGDITFNTTIANMSHYKSGVALSHDRMVRATAEEIKIMHTKCMGPDDMITSLSGGNQQKVIFGKWLERSPSVFMMDDPTRGIDVGAKYEIYELIINMAKQGKTIIVVSSEMPEILGITNRIGVMSNGRLAGIVNTKETDQEELLRLSAKYL